jgi:chloramphenicol O-acetyltransferase
MGGQTMINIITFALALIITFMAVLIFFDYQHIKEKQEAIDKELEFVISQYATIEKLYTLTQEEYKIISSQYDDMKDAYQFFLQVKIKEAKQCETD